MLENSAPPFIWPIEDVQLALDLGLPWSALLGSGDGSSIAGVVWGLDQAGVSALEELIAAGTRVKLVIALFAASRTDGGRFNKSSPTLRRIWRSGRVCGLRPTTE